MNNSNELFHIYILTTLKSHKWNLISTDTATGNIWGYYKALEEMDGTDELTTLYKDLAYMAIAGTKNQKANAWAMLEGTLSLETLMDNKL